MYKKYRLYLQTSAGSYVMAASDTVNDLVDQVREWLDRTSSGRGVYDDTVQAVVLYELDPDTGAYVFSKKLPASSRREIINKTRELGGR
jgi:hypothetical protein